METQKVISGDSIDEVWQKVSADMGANEVLLEYSVVINIKTKKVYLEIDIDPGGGFESGYQTTTLKSSLQNSTDFKFGIHHQGFIDEIGKFFGMQDIIIGYPEFDKKVIVKSNNEQKVKSLFTEESVRNIFKDLTNFTFHTTHHHIAGNDIDGIFLELNIEEGITDPVVLREIFTAYYSILLALDAE